jgi:ubiquinone/menaquinone biosynthesis C-methylase UbiE
VVDVGGGSGGLGREVLRAVSVQLYIVVDIDPVLASMVESGPAVERVVADAHHVPLRRCSAEVAVFHDSLHHMDRPERVLEEAARVSRSVLVVDFAPSTGLGRVLKLLERLLGFPAAFLEAGRAAGLLRKYGCSHVTVQHSARSSYTVLCSRKRCG